MAPAQVARLIKARAARRRLSLNRTVLELLGENAGLDGQRPAPENHDLDFLIGTWSAMKARDFDEALADQRRIDSEMWG